MAAEPSLVGDLKRMAGNWLRIIGISQRMYMSIGNGHGTRMIEPMEMAPLSRWLTFLLQRFWFWFLASMIYTSWLFSSRCRLETTLARINRVNFMLFCLITLRRLFEWTLAPHWLDVINCINWTSIYLKFCNNHWCNCVLFCYSILYYTIIYYTIPLRAVLALL